MENLFSIFFRERFRSELKRPNTYVETRLSHGFGVHLRSDVSTLQLQREHRWVTWCDPVA